MKIIACLVFLFAAAVLAGPIEDLQPGQWYEVPNSHLEDVKASSTEFPWVAQGEQISGIMNDWCGAAYDTERDRLYVGPGGGHNGYYGNEVYGFDLNTFKWTRLTDPNPVSGECPDASKYPCAIHTYDGLEYIPPPVDRYMFHGGWGSPHTYLFDPDAKTWEVITSRAGSNDPTNQISALNPNTNTVWAGRGTLMEFNATAKTWGTETEYDNGVRWGRQVLTCDPKRNLLVAVGHYALSNGSEPTVVTWDISGNTSPIRAVKMPTTGATEILAAGGQDGVVYDPVADKIVAWKGGPDVYMLDMDTKVWTKKAATNSVDPGPRNMNGTFGRFRYSPKKNVHVVVSGVNKNVFLYRLEAGLTVSETALLTIPALQVFPNPARAGETVRFSGSENLRVFNLAGQRVFSGTGAWKTAGMPAGIYLIRAAWNGRSVSRKILIQN